MSKQASTPKPDNIFAFPSAETSLPKFSAADLRTLMDASPQLEQVLGLHMSLNDADDLGHYVAFCRHGEQTSSWCLARKGASLVLWDSRTGIDLATTPTMGSMLCNLERAAMPKHQNATPSFQVVAELAVSEIICLQAARARRRGPAMVGQSKAS